MRIEKKNNFYDISICVVKKYRNMSLGTKALSTVNKKLIKMILKAKVNYKYIFNYFVVNSGFYIKVVKPKFSHVQKYNVR